MFECKARLWSFMNLAVLSLALKKGIGIWRDIFGMVSGRESLKILDQLYDDGWHDHDFFFPNTSFLLRIRTWPVPSKRCICIIASKSRSRFGGAGAPISWTAMFKCFCDVVICLLFWLRSYASKCFLTQGTD